MTNLTKLAIYGQLANVTDAMSMVRRARVLSTMSLSVGVICTYARARACAGEELARACAFTQRSNLTRDAGPETTHDHMMFTNDSECGFDFDKIKILDASSVDYRLRIIESVYL